LLRPRKTFVFLRTAIKQARQGGKIPSGNIPYIGQRVGWPMTYAGLDYDGKKMVNIKVSAC